MIVTNSNRAEQLIDPDKASLSPTPFTPDRNLAMTITQTFVVLAATASMAFVTATSAPASVVSNTATGVSNTFSVSSTDAADASQGGTTTFDGTATFGSNPDKVIDGDVYNDTRTSITTHSLTPSVDSELILHLDPSATYGWDISSIVALTGTNGSTQLGRSDHSYTIALSTDGSTFGAPIINVSDTTTAAEVQVTVYDNSGAPLGTGIKAVKFVFGNATDYTDNMFREIDVVAKAATAEPNVSPKGADIGDDPTTVGPSEVID